MFREKNEIVSKVKSTELSFPRKWESILFYGFGIPVFTGMTNKTQDYETTSNK